MRRVQYHRYGGPDVLALEDTATPSPGRGQVLVRVRAAATNPMDGKIRNGEMRFMTGRKFPRGVGHDVAGTIERLGAGVTGLQVGDDVLGTAPLRQAGAFTEFAEGKGSGLSSFPRHAFRGRLRQRFPTRLWSFSSLGRLRTKSQTAIAPPSSNGRTVRSEKGGIGLSSRDRTT